MKTAVALIFVCLLGGYYKGSNARIVEEIFNGRTASRGQFPYAVFIEGHDLKGQQYSCTGFLISTQWVVTAAHCAVNVNYTILTMGVVDRRDSSATKMTVTKENIYVNPTYSNSTNEGDLSLLKLPTPVTTSANISPINLPMKSQATVDTFAGRLATASGWGQTTVLPLGAQNQLQFASIYVMKNADCKKSYSSVTDSNICTDLRNYAGPCPGDSGGPLALNGTDGRPMVIGAVSYGRGCQSPFPIVYVNVAKYLDWISQTTGITVK